MREIWMCGFQGTDKTIPERILVTIAKGSHLFPYRTQKLSLSAPMVLGWRRPGRVGHCRIPNKKHTTNVVCFLFVPGQRLLSRCVPVKYVSTWLGESMAARSACNTAMDERPGVLHAKLLSASDEVWGSFHIQSTISYYPAIPVNVQHSTWLARSRAASSGRRKARGQRPGADSAEHPCGVLFWYY